MPRARPRARSRYRRAAPWLIRAWLLAAGWARRRRRRNQAGWWASSRVRPARYADDLKREGAGAARGLAEAVEGRVQAAGGPWHRGLGAAAGLQGRRRFDCERRAAGGRPPPRWRAERGGCRRLRVRFKPAPRPRQPLPFIAHAPSPRRSTPQSASETRRRLEGSGRRGPPCRRPPPRRRRPARRRSRSKRLSRSRRATWPPRRWTRSRSSDRLPATPIPAQVIEAQVIEAVDGADVAVEVVTGEVRAVETTSVDMGMGAPVTTVEPLEDEEIDALMCRRVEGGGSPRA